MIVRGVFLFGVVLFYAKMNLAMDVAFQEKPEEDPRRQNAADRKPYFVPGRCKENELLFPGDQVDDWICDCTPGYIFHPPTDKCHPAFRQGPCDSGNYLILRKNTVIPECIGNPCQEGQVPIKNQCYELGKPSPCRHPELSFVLGVNTTTLEISCVKLSAAIENRFGDLDFDNIPICPTGCKRYLNGKCPKAQGV